MAKKATTEALANQYLAFPLQGKDGEATGYPITEEHKSFVAVWGKTLIPLSECRPERMRPGA